MRQVTHALLTRPPLSHSSVRKLQSASFDLHVLSTPPAFILSQDQTLVKSLILNQNNVSYFNPLILSIITVRNTHLYEFTNLLIGLKICKKFSGMVHHSIINVLFGCF